MDPYNVTLQFRTEMLLIWNQARCECSELLIIFTPNPAEPKSAFFSMHEGTGLNLGGVLDQKGERAAEMVI